MAYKKLIISASSRKFKNRLGAPETIRLFRLMFADERYVGDFALIALFGATVRLQDGPQFQLEKTPA